MRYNIWLMWIIYVIIVIIGTEIFAYLWHRYGTHEIYIPGIHETHRIHHIIDIEQGHEADEDFIWTLFLIITFEIIVGIGILVDIFPGILSIVTVGTLLLVFIWNWWIHKAYHNQSHWLNNYEWFKKEKKRHFIHHKKPNKNYGIASHFTDKFMGTWLEI